MKSLFISAQARLTARQIMSAGLLAAAVLAAGCSSTPGETGSGARDTGTYPNLNVPPQAATVQLTPEEEVAKKADLKSLQGRSVAGASAAGSNDQAELAQVAKTHGPKTLDEIEKKKQPATN